MNYTVTVYSKIDRSIRETHYFVSHAEARAEKSRLEVKYSDDLCVVEIEEVSDVG